ncbi:amino acid transporter [Laccaria bicolor S238N-H82]|uniref:Amino acid transporter n=1 Tax=Laccaria bicolor (strain S238N-H82 / ATCC MYA-4686) TaxID=486041 RepID=B0DAL9_LACBS|nr:amino acid transporter [Laccaria bicolor S238N-H82]EDR08557.1 amino acid transporter [Laccaria bicolor S238N-H82]|eukprot:XP_001880782.1 amino acid transporter [Laccaria bicolor S238N-H82]
MVEDQSQLESHEPYHRAEFEQNARVPGAPVEKVNPLGSQVTLLSAVMLNLGQITGSGIYAVPGVILNSVGSIGMLLLYWIIAPLFAFAALALYSELASMFPNRSGAEVVYLEQTYPRPRFLVSTAFATTTILLSFSASNAIVFAQYFLTAFEVPITPSRQTSVALAVVFITVGSVALSTKWSLRAVNALTTIKVASLAFIVATGIAVLCSLTRVRDPFANFQDLFSGTSTNANALATALVKTNHSFIGWQNAFNVLGEVRSRDPVRTVRKASFISLMVATVLFFFINVAYIAAVPREDIRQSGQLIAALFFRRVFGATFGSKVFPLMVACSCFGNIIAVTVGQARIIREVARQGLLPFPSFFSSTKPFGTPFGPVALKGGLTVIVILLVPAKDAFNFALDLASYPHLVFQAAMSAGVWLLRHRRAIANVPPSPLQAWNGAIIAYLISCILLLVLPWYPGHADVSFWYATYCVAGIGLLLCCGLYYWIWIKVLPQLGGYEIVEEIDELADGARNTRLVRRYRHTAENEHEPLLGR